jgi:hypothetical protein
MTAPAHCANQKCRRRLPFQPLTEPAFCKACRIARQHEHHRHLREKRRAA